MPYAWSVVAGSLAPGLTLNPTSGVITGRPTTLGSFVFTVRVTDSQAPAATASRTLGITVNK